MVNQIAANFAHHPASQAAEEVATHIRMFWTPAMREDLESWIDMGAEELHPLAVEAMRLLRKTA
jgi:formate dehydrogenase subunit delta